jgi:hypothetical protein
LEDGGAGKCISHEIVMAWKMMKSGIEFRKEGEVALLARGKSSGLFGDSRNKRFVICEECERMTFKEETEMFGSEESSQQFPLKSVVAVEKVFWRRKKGAARSH